MARRYNCGWCKYKEDFRFLVTDCITKDLRVEELQRMCSYLRLPINKPEEWPALPDSKTCPRSAILWNLDMKGFINEWTLRPDQLQKILKRLLDRVDLASNLQDLLCEYAPPLPPREPSADESNVALPIQKELCNQAEERDFLFLQNPLEEEEPEKDKVRRESTNSMESIASSVYGGDRKMSSGSMTNTGGSLNRCRSRLPRLHDSGVSFTSKVNISITHFCFNCREWINNGSPQASPQLQAARKDVNSEDHKHQPSDSGSSSSESESSPDLRRSASTKQISGRIAVKRKELIKILSHGQRDWSAGSQLDPDLEVGRGNPFLFMRLHPEEVPELSGFFISLNLMPYLTGSRAFEVPAMMIKATVYEANKKELNAEKKKLAANELITTVMSTSKLIEIARFSNLIRLDQLKEVKQKYIIIEVGVVVDDE